MLKSGNVWAVQGGRYSDIVIHKLCRLGSFFGVQNFEFQYFFWFSENIYFLGMKILWIFFFFLGGGVITKSD